MPRGDGTGPEGQGPLTGRGLGPCGSGSDASGQNQTLGRRLFSGIGNVFNNFRQGQGMGGGRGQGRGSGRGTSRGGGRGRNR